ncbi:hypothetical protein QBC47DRAFT_460059 [Echria macrotheca]|uniref:Uncharacterized protein n=1 Tax=Echria macrotheca TaxID=438768 RepID=A0AAJ0BDB2_9PEZI|nr:hypothetical protein QBC47DRAFT_460059 [Echria macrotheca]
MAAAVLFEGIEALTEVAETAEVVGTAEAVGAEAEVAATDLAAEEEEALLAETTSAITVPSAAAAAERSAVRAAFESGQAMAANLGRSAARLATNIWGNKLAYAKAAGIEVGKGAFFTAGMKAFESTWKSIFETNPTPVNKRRVAIIQAVNKQRKIITVILKEWQTWMTEHFDNRESYGHISVEGVNIGIFQILQNKISVAREYDESAVQRALELAAEKGDQQSAESFLTKEQAFIRLVTEAAGFIKTKGGKMVDDGLKHHYEDVEQAEQALHSL